MSAASCTAPTPAAALIDYWLGELEGEREVELEEHLFGCEPCSARLRDLARLGEGIGHAMRAGHVPAVLTAAFIRRLQASGMRVREYRLQPGGSVNCTVAPDDDLVIAHLHAPLGGVQRLDLLFDDVTSGARWRSGGRCLRCVGGGGGAAAGRGRAAPGDRRDAARATACGGAHHRARDRRLHVQPLAVSNLGMFRRGRPRCGGRGAGRVPEKIVNQVDDSRAEGRRQAAARRFGNHCQYVPQRQSHSSGPRRKYLSHR